MSIIIQIASGIGMGFLILCSVFVIIAALFPPKEYRGDGRVDARRDMWDESIEDV